MKFASYNIAEGTVHMHRTLDAAKRNAWRIARSDVQRVFWPDIEDVRFEEWFRCVGCHQESIAYYGEATPVVRFVHSSTAE